MYSPKIIQANLNLAQSTIPFTLSETPIALADLRVDHFNNLINLDRWREKRIIEFKDPTRVLTEEEQHYIKNEQLFCTLSYPYFATRYARIDTWDAGLGHFIPNKAQRILNSVRAKMEERYRAILILILKARQEGMSTDVQVSLLHRALFHEDSRILIASSKEDKTHELFSKFTLALEHIPWFLLPEYELTTTGEERFKTSILRTKVKLQWGNQKGGVGRGETPRQGHLTEIPDWLNPKEDIQNSLMKSMHFTPDTYLIEESTAKFRGDYWNEQWEDAVEYYPRGLSYFYPMFLPWYVADDIYPTSTWLRDFPIPTDWVPPDMVLAMKLRAEHNVRTNPLLREHMGAQWTMPMRQLWFWHMDREVALREKRLGSWISEMPSSAKEAFNVRGSSIFDSEHILDLRAKARPPMGVFAIEGVPDEIPARFLVPDSTDEGLPAIPIFASWGNYESTFSLRPLLVPDFEALDPHGKLIIYELPLEEESYYITVDCGMGLGQDRTIIYVMRKGDLYRTDEEVAEFASPWINGEELWPFLMCVATFYSVSQLGSLQQAMLAIELQKGGDSCQARMIEHGWRKIYIHVPSTLKDKDASKRASIGFSMNSKAIRDAVLTEFITDVRGDDLQINSPWLMDEMQTFGMNERTRKLEALGSGTHDDRVMAAAICSYIAHIYDKRSGKTSMAARRSELQRKQDEAAMSRVYSLGDMAKPVRARNYGGGYYD